MGGAWWHGETVLSGDTSVFPFHLRSNPNQPWIDRLWGWKFCENALALIAIEGEDKKGRQQAWRIAFSPGRVARLKASHRALGLWFSEFMENKGGFCLLVVPGILAELPRPEEAETWGFTTSVWGGTCHSWSLRRTRTNNKIPNG